MDFLVIDDDRGFREATCFLIENESHYAEGVGTGDAARQRLKEDRFDVVLLDLRLGAEDGLAVLDEITRSHPGLPVVMFTASGSIRAAVDALQRGAVDFLEKPFTRDQFHTVLARLQKFRRLGQKVERLEAEVRETRAETPLRLFESQSPAMQDTYEVLLRAAATPASILLLGESGTGKSVLARAIHAKSHLSEHPFVTVSCPSLSRELLESDLFGHVKGAFTGAVKDHWGKVRAAEGGTLFLDEIGDLPLEIQPKLLRLLQEHEYERLGENITRTARVRVIAATNRDLKQRIAEGTFREDLFYRLNVIAVEMPPLRARPADVDFLAHHYLAHFAAQCGRTVRGFQPEAAALVRQHPWPGNLRELRNTVERAVILARGDHIAPSDLPAELRRPAVSSSAAASTPEASPQVGGPCTLEQLEEAHLRQILARSTSLAEAATVLGIDQATLYRKRKRLGLD